MFFSSSKSGSLNNLEGVEIDVGSPFLLNKEYIVFKNDSKWKSLNINWLLSLEN